MYLARDGRIAGRRRAPRRSMRLRSLIAGAITFGMETLVRSVVRRRLLFREHPRFRRRLPLAYSRSGSPIGTGDPCPLDVAQAPLALDRTQEVAGPSPGSSTSRIPLSTGIRPAPAPLRAGCIGAGPGARIPLSVQRFAEPREVAERASDASLGLKACLLRPLRERRGSYPVRIAEQLSHHESATRLDHAMQLTQREVLIRDLTEDRNQERTVEAVGGVRQRMRISLRRDHVVQPPLARGLDRVVQHFLLEIEDLKRPVWPK
jgi:hypothetical protein